MNIKSLYLQEKYRMNNSKKKKKKCIKYLSMKSVK